MSVSIYYWSYLLPTLAHRNGSISLCGNHATRLRDRQDAPRFELDGPISPSLDTCAHCEVPSWPAHAPGLNQVDADQQSFDRR